jgi:biopolymer transport protein ExbB/TolQ
MDFSLAGLWDHMGWVARGVVIILIGMSIYSIGISVERFLMFRKGRLQSIGYIGALQPLVGSTGRLREAVGLDQRFRGSPVAKVIGTGINEFVRGVEMLGPRATDSTELDIVVDGVHRSMERIKEREIANLRRGLPVLATVASSSPFVGLFGTTFGIITAFQGMADPAKGGGGLASVSAGIAEALLTTAVGLAVAIVSVWFFNFFSVKVEDVTVDVDETAGEVLDGMIREGRALAGGGMGGGMPPQQGPHRPSGMHMPPQPPQPQRW